MTRRSFVDNVAIDSLLKALRCNSGYGFGPHQVSIGVP
jgi:hypothetical protein